MKVGCLSGGNCVSSEIQGQILVDERSGYLIARVFVEMIGGWLRPVGFNHLAHIMHEHAHMPIAMGSIGASAISRGAEEGETRRPRPSRTLGRLRSSSPQSGP